MAHVQQSEKEEACNKLRLPRIGDLGLHPGCCGSPEELKGRDWAISIWRESALMFVKRMGKKGKMEAGPGEAAGAAEVSLLGS